VQLKVKDIVFLLLVNPKNYKIRNILYYGAGMNRSRFYWIVLIISILTLIISIIWQIAEPGFEPGHSALTSLAALISTIISIFVINREQKNGKASLAERDRTIMLDHVENFWVKGILDKSLHGLAIIELGLREDPKMVVPFGEIRRESSEEILPAGKNMQEVFYIVGMGRSMLILGDPGSGKTSLLIELARKLIGRARKDDCVRIPVIFNLSSWKTKETLNEWLVRELRVFYKVPKKEAETWVENDELVLLLDGLDEVKTGLRDECVEQINIFREEHGLVPMVVCSRFDEYKEINYKLNFDGAITIMPITKQQVNHYLREAGGKLDGVRKLLSKDPILRELTQTPLMLSVMTVAYARMSEDTIGISSTVEIRRKHMFDTYINRMFERPGRSKPTRFANDKVIEWLCWVAYQMKKLSRSVFMIEGIIPKMLDSKSELYQFRMLANVLGGLIFVIVGLLVIPVMVVDIHFWIVAIGAVIFSTSIFGYIYENWTFQEPGDIFIPYEMSWSWNEVKKGIIYGLGVGWIFALFLSLMFWWIKEPKGGLSTVIKIGFYLWIAIVFILGVTDGIELRQTGTIHKPGEGIKRALQHFVRISCIVGLIGSIPFMMGMGLRRGLFMGIGVGLMIGWSFIGFAITRHYSLRLTIVGHGKMPWRMIPLLNNATELLFLRKVGSGYIFIHNLLRDHFAEMYKLD